MEVIASIRRSFYFVIFMEVEVIQHEDINIGPNTFPRDRLFVRNIFYTIQGEGPFAGVPAIFVRLAGCNRGQKSTMGCDFCDTDFLVSKAVEWEPAKLAESIHVMITTNFPKCDLVVITGGEPMMQEALVPFMIELFRCTQLSISNLRIQIESNGDRLARDWLGALDRGDIDPGWVWLVVSPKINAKLRRYIPLKTSVLTAADCLKFLVDGRPESPYHKIPEYADEFCEDSTREVFISPITVYKHEVVEGFGPVNFFDNLMIDQKATQLNMKYALQLAMAKGYRISVQMHLLLGVE